MVIPEKRTLGSWGRPFSSSRAGSASHEPWLRVELEDPPKVFFDVASDTCLADVDHAGIGGFCHGLFWFYEVPEDVRPYLTIPVLEFLALAAGSSPSSNTSVGPAEPGSTGPTCASFYARTPSLQRLPFQRAPLMPRSCRRSTITFAPPPNGRRCSSCWRWRTCTATAIRQPTLSRVSGGLSFGSSARSWAFAHARFPSRPAPSPSSARPSLLPRNNTLVARKARPPSSPPPPQAACGSPPRQP